MNGGDLELSLSLKRQHAGKTPQQGTSLACGCGLSCQQLAEQRKGRTHAHPEGLSDAGCRGLAGVGRAEKMMSESLSSDTLRPAAGTGIPNKDSQVAFPTSEPEHPMALPPALSRLDCWDRSSCRG